jgi:hypothetical protein
MERISRCKETFIPMWPMYFVFSRVVEYNLWTIAHMYYVKLVVSRHM